MSMLSGIIRRPVLATSISVIIVLLGIIGFSQLAVSRFPDISPPTVIVSGSYPGGSSETVFRSVVMPLEEQINGVENMAYMKSTAGNDGSFSVSIVFRQGVSPDQAVVNVQNRVQRATPVLPPEVIRAGLTISRQQNSTVLIFNLFAEDNKRYDERFLQNYMNISLIPQIKRIAGVGQVHVFGNKDYAMRIWLDPRKMAVLNLEPGDITAAIADHSLESAPGKLGGESDATLEYAIRYKGKKNLPESYENIIVRSSGANITRLKDVARVEFGSVSYSGDNKCNGHNAVTVAVSQTAGSDARKIETGITKAIEQLSTSFPPGIQFSKVISTKDKLDQAIGLVKSTLTEAFILVLVVVFLFLRDIRSTLVLAVAVPVAIVGTFFFLLLLGFTLNILTLFALVLATGIVVDDAIMVVEAVRTKLETGTLPARQATREAMSEMTGPVISFTVVMAAVVIPIGFMTGSEGIFYKQFAYTLAVAVALSGLNTLTLTPALCALLFRKQTSRSGMRDTGGFATRFSAAFNAGLDTLTERYVNGLRFLTRHKWLSLGFMTALLATSGWAMLSTPRSFVPMEDDGMFLYSLEMPPGTALGPTTEAVRQINRVLAEIQAVDENTSITGINILSNSSGPAYAFGFIKLKPKEKRGRVRDIDELMEIVNGKLATIREGSVMAMRMPPADGFGLTGGAEIVLQDRVGRSPDALKGKADALIAQLTQIPGVQFAYTSFRSDYPQFELEVDEDKAGLMGVSVNSMLGAIQTYFSGDQSLNFSRFGKLYRVNVKADGIFRADESAFNEIFVRNNQGQMVPVKALVKLKKVYGPESVYRYNLYNALTIHVVALPGVSKDVLMEHIEKILDRLPADYGYEWTGLSLEEKSAGNQTIWILSLCLLFVYLLLAARYESYLLPLVVLLSIPAGVLGAYLGIKAAGLDNNIYFRLALIMLIGLLAKNAILIVEFALQRRFNGLSIREAAFDAAKTRLRPIVMTSLAFIVGMFPLMVATGDTEIGNRSVSVSAAAGMVSGVLLGVFVVPVLFVFFQYLQELISFHKPSLERS